jgi:hypothetical protein
MTIEFHCPYCQKLLKTADDKAGVRANCPGCGEPVTVPELVHEAAEADSSLAAEQDAAAAAAPSAGLEVGAAPEGGLAAQESPSADTRNCPMCGASIKAAATKCRFCGESLVDQGAGAPAQIDAGEVLSRTWELYQKRLGLLVGLSLILLGIRVAMFIAMYAVQLVVMFSAFGAGAPPPRGPASLVLLLAAVYGPMFVFLFLFLLVTAFLEGGCHLLLIRLARGEPAEISDMFSGGRYFWRMVLSNLAFWIVVYAGFFLLIAPGIFVALAFWPFMYVIVDHDVGVIESFRRSRELMSGNYLAIFVLWLGAFGANALGSMFCLGMIFTMPFGLLLFAVAYCMMTGRVATRTSM